jgi:hypothetical protein
MMIETKKVIRRIGVLLLLLTVDERMLMWVVVMALSFNPQYFSSILVRRLQLDSFEEMPRSFFFIAVFVFVKPLLLPLINIVFYMLCLRLVTGLFGWWRCRWSYYCGGG